MKKPLTRHMLGLTVASCLLGACTTLSPVGHQASTQEPKDILEKAAKSQLRSSFSYETTMYVSNDIRRQALASISKEVAGTNDDCEKIHDDGYVDLLKTAKAEGLPIADDKYQAKREQLKNDFLTCRDEQQKALAYQPFDFETFYEEIQGLSPEEQEAAFGVAMQAHLDLQSSSDPAPSNITPLDAKKAELFHEYFLRPSGVSVTGSYLASSGKLTALPMLDYTTNNLKLSVNQPIYIDLKAGGIYLWADNFAFLVSELLDAKLGGDWQGKWLYIPINDGSFPKDFSNDLIKAYITAKKESFMALPKEGFVTVDSKSVTALPFIQQQLPADKLALIQNTPIIIKNDADDKSKSYSRYVFADTLYQEMTTKYPTLTLQLPDFYEREIIDGESVIHVVNADGETGMPEEQVQNEEGGIKINSELLMRGLFLYLQKQIGEYYGDLQGQQGILEDSGGVSGQINGDDLKSDTKTTYVPATHYGIEQGKIAWVHHRYYLHDDMAGVGGVGTHYMHKAGVTGTEPLLVDVFTQIFQNAKHMNEFARLPTASQTPNANNSVNLFAYQEALRARFKETKERPPIVEQYQRYSSMGVGGGYGGYDDMLGDEPSYEPQYDPNDSYDDAEEQSE